MGIVVGPAARPRTEQRRHEPNRTDDRRAVPGRAPPRHRRDGRRLRLRGPPARPPRRGQGAPRAAGRGPPGRGPLPPREPVGRRAPASAHRLGLRPRRLGRHPVHGDGARRRGHAQGRHPRPGAARPGQVDRPDLAGPRRPPLRPPPRARPPRHQAAEHPRRARRRPQGGGLRDRSRDRRSPDDPDGHDRRDGALPLAGAGLRPGDHPVGRPLRRRRRALRDADRPDALRGRPAGRDRAQARQRGAAGAVGGQPRRPGRPRVRRDAGAGQGAGGALRRRRGVHRRAPGRPSPDRLRCAGPRERALHPRRRRRLRGGRGPDHRWLAAAGGGDGRPGRRRSRRRSASRPRPVAAATGPSRSSVASPP